MSATELVIPPLDVTAMDRAALADHIDDCIHCGSDDPGVQADARDEDFPFDEVRDYVAGIHPAPPVEA